MESSTTKRAMVCILVLGTLAACAQQQVVTSPRASRTSPQITTADLRARIYEYADDSMMGREAGTPGNEKATTYLAAEARRIGLEPAGENGTYFQDIRATSARFAATPRPGTARNVIAVIRGSDPVLRNEYVAIGAHNDHVGMRRAPVDHDSLRAASFQAMRMAGADAGHYVLEAARAAARVNVDSLRRIRPARLDSIYNGADDDASGTIAVMEIAEAISSQPVKPRRSILLVWHTAEEKGLLGAKWFTDNPTVPRSAIVAQLNLDMVGRGGAADIKGGGPTYLQLVGSRRLSTQMGDIVEQINATRTDRFKFDYELDRPGHPERIYCRSDHYMYARYGIPVTFFTTGLHPDYHQVTDEAQYIDYDHLSRVTDFVRDITLHLANLPQRPRVDKPVPGPEATCVQ